MSAVYDIYDVASLLDVHHTTVREMARDDELPGMIKIRSRIKFSKEKIDKWLGVTEK